MKLRCTKITNLSDDFNFYIRFPQNLQSTLILHICESMLNSKCLLCAIIMMIIGKMYSNPTCVSEESSLNAISFKDIKRRQKSGRGADDV